MSAYRIEDERAIRVQRLVADWAKSGLLNESQRARMMSELQVDLRRTNLFLRATLFVFGFLIVMAMAGLTALMVDLSRGMWVWAAVLGAAAFIAALQSVRRYRLYRFGIEEAFTVASVLFFGFAAGTFVADAVGVRDDPALSAGLAGLAAVAFLAFHYFGYVYAAILSMLCAAAIPLQSIDEDVPRRLLAVAIVLAVFVAVRRTRAGYDGEYPGDSYAIIEAAAWASAYLLINLKLSSWIAQPDDSRTFYWLTYGATWLWPAIGLWLAIRDRHRWMLDVSIAMALATLMTNKEYLGTERYAYDPIAFGVLLIAIAIGLRRWLASGEGETRAGFTARRLLASDQERLAVAGTATVLAPGAPDARTQTEPEIGGGGRSGGAGASGSY